MSHNLQLVYSDVFKHRVTGDAKIKKIVTHVYSVMTDYNTGQAGSVFMETASKLNHVVLSNKARQDTRFVRSDLCGLQAYMTNVPTIYCIQGEVFAKCSAAGDNLGAKKAKTYIDKLCDGTELATIIGYCQFLEIYCQASLESQHARKFPTTCMKAVIDLDDKLEKLCETWSWEEESLKLAGFGAPKIMIQDLLSGVYRPYVSKNTARPSTINPNLYINLKVRRNRNILATGVTEEELEENLDWTPPVAHNDREDEDADRGQRTSGEIPVIEFDQQKLEEVESRMK